MSGGQCAQSALAHRGAQQFGQLLRGLSGRCRLSDRCRSRRKAPARMLARREGQHSRVDKDEDHWEARISAVWSAAGESNEAEVPAAVTALVGERAEQDGVGLFELASAYDFAGLEAEAEQCYKAALAAGLDDYRRPRAVVQLASTMRNRGQPAESVELLRPEFARTDDPHFRAACAAFLSLALVDCGRSTEAVATALHGLVPLLNDYGRSVSHYASELSQRANGVHSQPVP